jgi:transcriptional regulator with PAS, ATPase and Fis domain
VDVRIIAATNKSLKNEVKERRFREDLFFRLNVLFIAIPPLRDRVDDIPLLADHFLAHFKSEVRSPAERISPEAKSLLQSYPWKGNVRELQNVIQRALITATRPVVGTDVFGRILGLEVRGERNLKSALRDFEISHIRRVLEETGGNKQLAAERLGISLASLYSKLKN